jgi:uncharacterized protein (TIGR02996 family)
VNDHDALLAAIIADPADDLPRLALADWLDENGQPHRAQFIRLQLEQAALPPGEARWRKLDDRAGELLRKHGKKWAAPLAACGLGRLEYRRGFAEEAMIDDVGLFVDNYTRVAALAPLHDIRFDWDFDPREQEDESPALLRFLESPAAARITKLDMGDADGIPLLESLLSCPHLTGVRTIVANCQTGDSGAEVAHLIACSPRLRSLRSLRILAYDTGNEGLNALANVRHLAKLEELSLGDEEGGSSAEIGLDGVNSLVRSRYLRRLRWINLCGNPIGDAGASALASAPYLKALQMLSLGGCGLSELGLLALAKSRRLPALRHLALTVSTLPSDTVNALITSPVLNRLDYFFLGTESRPGDTARGEQLWRLHFGDDAYSRLTAHFGSRILCDQAEWYP